MTISQSKDASCVFKLIEQLANKNNTSLPQAAYAHLKGGNIQAVYLVEVAKEIQDVFPGQDAIDLAYAAIVEHIVKNANDHRDQWLSRGRNDENVPIQLKIEDKKVFTRRLEADIAQWTKAAEIAKARRQQLINNPEKADTPYDLADLINLIANGRGKGVIEMAHAELYGGELGAEFLRTESALSKISLKELDHAMMSYIADRCGSSIQFSFASDGWSTAAELANKDISSIEVTV